MNRSLSFDFNDNLGVKISYHASTNYSCAHLIINNANSNEMIKN